MAITGIIDSIYILKNISMSYELSGFLHVVCGCDSKQMK